MLDWSQVWHYGWPIAFLCAIGVGVWRASVYLVDRLFHEEKGMLTNLLEGHLKFLNSVAEDTQTNREALQDESRSLRDLTLTSEAINQRLEELGGQALGNHAKTHQGLIYIMHGLVLLSREQGMEPDMQEIFKKTEALLR